jgi:pheromone shutdown protein TraB
MPIEFIKTSHIAQESIETIKERLVQDDVDIVAIELDPKRLQGLMTRQRTSHPPSLIFKVGVLGYLFAVIGSYVQRKLGSVVGVNPGSEMLTAFEEGQRHGLNIFLIDQDIERTLHRLSNTVPFSEKLALAWEMGTGWLRGGPKINVDLDKVPEDELIEDLKEMMESKFPNLYRVLVTERNHLMANRLQEIQRQHPDAVIVAVVGAGHGADVERLVT